MVLDIPTADFFGIVRHDGSQKAFPMLPDPMSRRGLHIQECIAACLKLGYAVTPVELFPVIRATLLEGQNPSPCGICGNAPSQCVKKGGTRLRFQPRHLFLQGVPPGDLGWGKG